MAFFKIVKLDSPPPATGRRCAYLFEDRWDDWGKYRTQFRLIVFDESGNRFEPGDVKIAELGLQPAANVSPGFRAPALDAEFDELDERYFSVGQGETYYETLNQCSAEIRDNVLNGLRDCAFDLTRFESMQGETVMQESLLRGIAAENVRSRFHRLALGDATLTKFRFAFDLPSWDLVRPLIELTFKIKPYSTPPTNVHVLIGRNGVGKSRCMQSLVRAILQIDIPDEPKGVLRQLKDDVTASPWMSTDSEWRFAGLIFVSFSAFDTFELPDTSAQSIKTTIVGLRKPLAGSTGATSLTKSRQDLNNDFIKSFEACRQGLRAERLRAALLTLSNDPLFGEADIGSYIDNSAVDWRTEVLAVFDRLSSGHAVVLLTITRLVEVVDERTLVLLDEPEGHLHPPLLSAFIRSLADLLIKRNGVAIIATHSPVVLQEVPKSCVWKLRRTGAIMNAERPDIETFGENVGILTREVFGLEVVNAGFHKLIKDAVEVEKLTYEEILERFADQLGTEARAIARALVANREAGGGIRP